MECSNKLRINEFIGLALLKRKFKAHLVDLGCVDYKQSVFSQGLVL